MYARVTIYENAGENPIPLELMRQGFEFLTGELRQIPGFHKAYLLGQPETSRAMTVTLWDTEEALRASEEQTARMRGEGAQAAGGMEADIQRYEVVLEV